jgi:hypothetical protein
MPTSPALHSLNASEVASWPPMSSPHTAIRPERSALPARVIARLGRRFSTAQSNAASMS